MFIPGSMFNFNKHHVKKTNINTFKSRSIQINLQNMKMLYVKHI